MKRWPPPLLLLALLLLAGAVMNVAVAEAIILWPLSLPERPAEQPAPPSEAQHAQHWRQVRRVKGIGMEIVSWQAPAETRPQTSSWGFVLLNRYRAGWPFPSLEYLLWVRGERKGGATIRILERYRGVLGGIELRRASSSPATPVPRRLALSPVLPGFAINTLFYTAVLALPLSFFPIRRRLRARRGRCTKCGYDLAGLGDSAAPCPECGATR